MARFQFPDGKIPFSSGPTIGHSENRDEDQVLNIRFPSRGGAEGDLPRENLDERPAWQDLSSIQEVVGKIQEARAGGRTVWAAIADEEGFVQHQIAVEPNDGLEAAARRLLAAACGDPGRISCSDTDPSDPLRSDRFFSLFTQRLPETFRSLSELNAYVRARIGEEPGAEPLPIEYHGAYAAYLQSLPQTPEELARLSSGAQRNVKTVRAQMKGAGIGLID